jgi:predicted permease
MRRIDGMPTTFRRVVASARAAVRRWLAGSRVEDDLHEEIESFAEMVADEKRAAGLSEGDARRLARAEIGGVEQVKESVRQGRAGALFEQTWQDIRYALRGLRRTPGFTAIAVLTVGLGIGVNTSVFAVVDATIFQPLPYADADQLVEVRHFENRGTATSSFYVAMSWDERRLWLQQTELFVGSSAYDTRLAAMTWREDGRPIKIVQYTAGTPEFLGIRPLAGRSFTAAEADARAPVLLIGEELWSRGFARSPSAIGTIMTIGDTAYTVIGVMPATFRFGPGGNGQADAWTGLPERADAAVPGSDVTTPIFRLRAGLPLDVAQKIVERAGPTIEAAAPSQYGEWTADIRPIRDGRNAARGVFRTQLLSLLAMSSLVLLIASANMANLLSVRGARRRAELSLRAALGATRTRLVRLLIVEGTVICALGSGLAVGLAAAGGRAFFLLMPPSRRQALFEAGVPAVDHRALIFSLVTCAIVAILASVWPAMRSARITASNRIAGDSPRRQPVAGALLALQVALALMLVTGTSLMAASFVASVRHDLGFRTDGLGWITVRLPSARYQSVDARRAGFDAVHDAILGRPGIEAAAFGMPPPTSSTAEFRLPGAAVSDAARVTLRARIGPGYFATAGIQVLSGREFNREDRMGNTPVAMIDDVAARRFFPSTSPIGRQFTTRRGQPVPYTIVGVVSAVASADFNVRPTQPAVYLPLDQELKASPMAHVLIRADRNLNGALKDAAAAVAAFDPDIAVSDPYTVASYLDKVETFSSPRYYLVIASIFAGLAVLIAAIGLYGVLAFNVGRRRREIGVRMALGATSASIRRMVVGDALRPVLSGVLIGAAGAAIGTGYLSAFLYGVGPRDPRLFALSAGTLVIAALIAAIVPMRAATKVEPVVVLRGE